MNTRLALLLFCLLCCLLVALPLQAAGPVLDRDNLPSIQNPLNHIPAAADPAKAVTDTFSLIGPWGSGAPFNGQFQDISGMPAWNGWTSHDLTQPDELYWHVSDYMESGGNLSLYCGDELIPSCDMDDPVGGYGNDWNDQVEYRYQVPDPGASCLMTVSGVLSHSTEAGYDFVEMRFLTADGHVQAEYFDGEGEGISFAHSFTYEPTDYLGDQQDEVAYRIVFKSDGIYSDADCLFTGSGACRVDNILVECSNGDHSYFHDFQDGTLGQWEVVSMTGTGDFADLWQGLEDLDPCITNYSPQVAFIDDGTQVEGVGPSNCITWCYGPGGYIVNTTGGAAGEGAHLHNTVVSPAMEWDGTALDGGLLSFDVYRHMVLGNDGPGMFYFWEVRSSASPEEIEEAQWDSQGLVLSGGPDYIRHSLDVSPYIIPGAEAVQVQLGVFEIGWIWGFIGNDGTPAPYFDNVSLKVYDKVGPDLSIRSYHQAQDNFPEAGVLNLEDLAANNVRFDMARNVPSLDPELVFGDSLSCRITPSRPGGEIVQTQLHYTMDRNPLFDAVRDPAFGPTGVVDGYQTLGGSGLPLANRFHFDLPDSGFLFPGDIIHYYISATETVNGQAHETATIPADLTGYGFFEAPLMYSSDFVMRALPSLGDTFGSQPELLFWDDSSGHDDANRWYWALLNLGLQEGVHYDRYVTKGASSAAGNGLGSRCTTPLMDGYRALIYTAGDLSFGTLENGDPNNLISPDLPLLNDWLALGYKDALLMGDNLASDLVESSFEGSIFVNETMGLNVLERDIRPMISSQTSPRVLPTSPNPIFYMTPAWIVDGGCPRIAQFDAVVTTTGTQRLAEFTTPAGNPGYAYAAAALNQLVDGSRVISMPFSLDSVADDPDFPVPQVHHRNAVLQEVLQYFLVDHWDPPISPVPEVGEFQLANHPNPFNPATRIDFNLPRDGRIEVKVFNLRGELVTTLLDEARAAGPGHVMWDGKDGGGAQVGSGLYFCEARAAGAVKVQKMTLLK